ncbi:MAG TPA: CDP-glycerol glycerophosphotransferase family protein [Candidatus Dojkabacteria bacterium]|nr:CDP-glycerol glycerophosphotransferase family protein [Candidatus Dojkabacteria bacterium]
MIKILIKLTSFIYHFFKKRKIRNKVCFLSRQGNTPGLDFQLLIASLKEKGIETYVSCHKVKYSPSYYLVLLKDLFNIANSKVVIIDGYSLAVSNFTHKEELKVFQIWHSMGTMKKFGKQIIGKKDGRGENIAHSLNMHKQYDYIIASSKEYAKDLAEGFGYDSSYVHIYSLPRVDLLNNKKYEKEIQDELYQKYPVLKERENITFAPTFKNNNLVLENIKDILSIVDFSKHNLILSLHPLDEKDRIKIKNLTKENNRVIYDQEHTTFDFLFVSDKLISDYSCVIYDAMVRDIVVFLYVPDLNQYVEDRGLTIDIEKEYKGYVFKDRKELQKRINSKIQKEDLTFYQNKRKKYVVNIDNANEKLVKFILKEGKIT